MAVKNEPHNQMPQTLNQRLDHWINNSAPGWVRYLLRLEWHHRPETRTEAVLNYGAIVLILVAAIVYLISTI